MHLSAAALCGVLAMSVPAVAAAADTYTVTSPDERNAITIICTTNGLRYAIHRDGHEVVKPSAIAITLDGRVLPDLKAVTKAAVQTHDGTVEPVVPTIAATIEEHYREGLLTFADGAALRVRAYHDGVAFRWETTADRAKLVVNAEQFTCTFAGDYPVYFPIPNGEGFFSHHENKFDLRPVAQTRALAPGPAPLLANLGERGYLLISDVNVEGYPGLWFKGGDGATLTGVFPHYPAEVKLEGDRNAKVVRYADHLAVTTGKRSFPWRAFVLADAPGLLTSTMLYLLAEPSRLADPSWIRPGKVAWDWWNACNLAGVPFRAGINQDTYKHYIDFAAEMGVPYIILDEGWSERGAERLLDVVPAIDMAALVAYGQEKGVGLILWMTSAALEHSFDEAFEQFERWGIAGLKIDFMQRDDQVMMDFLYRAAEEAARRKLIVDYHGGSKPAGITRTWPNVLTIESVLGLEQAKWCTDANPEMAVLLPYNRMVVGPMDYTPGAMVNMNQKDFKPIFDRPASMGTRAQQLAMYVVYLSPLQMLADSPTHYRAHPESLPFLRQVPVTWDETRVLAAEVGEVAAVARRKGDDWYIGALTDWTARDLTLDLDFLWAGTYELTAWADGINADRYGDDVQVMRRSVQREDTLKVHLAPGGGYAAILKQQPSAAPVTPDSPRQR